MTIDELYSRYLTDQDAAMRERERAFAAAPRPRFTGAYQPERSTMSIASPYDARAAEIARTTLPKIANDVAMLGANFAPGSGEYLSAQQSAEDTAKAREAFAQGNYGEAAASGANALVNAVGSLPIAHQAIAAGKGAIGLAKGLLGGEHMLMAGAPFFSKLENVVASKMGGKSNIDDLVRMAKNNGVSDAEINATLGGMKGVISKPEAMGIIKERTPELKDVILGEPADRSTGFQLAYKDGSARFGETYRTAEEAQAALDEVGLGHKMEVVPSWASAEGEPSWTPRKTHFAQYTEPGGVEGSYREMFVTAPGGKIRKHEVYKVEDSSRPWRVRIVGEDQHAQSFVTEQEAIANAQERDSYNQVDGLWNDGHSEYKDIQNPIVRIRFNDRDVDGKKVLFVEEMQGPQDYQQNKMPSELKDRIYDIGTKRVLNYAKENGYDGVAWTKGDMQAKRYDLSKHLDRVEYKVFYNKPGDKDVEYFVQGYGKDGEGVFSDYYTQNELPNAVGKELAKKIVDGEGTSNLAPNSVGYKRFSGLDLQVGGEGLKSLYDKTLPSMFKKYGKEPVSTINIGKVYDELMRPYSYEGPDFTVHELTSKLQNANIFDTPYSTASNIRMIIKHMNDTGESFKNAADKFLSISDAEYLGGKMIPVPNGGENVVHYIPITEKTPDSFPHYADGGSVQKFNDGGTSSIEKDIAAEASQGIEDALAAEQQSGIEAELSQQSPSIVGLLEGMNAPSNERLMTPAAEKAPVQQATKPVQRTTKPVQRVAKTLNIPAMVTDAANRFGVPLWVAHGVASSESGYDPNATSSAGAGGVMQLMPSTAKLFGVTNIHDPRQNINAGMRYLSELIDKYKGNYSLALAAYNAGPTNVARYNGIPPFKETQAYVAKVLQHRNKKYSEGGRVASEYNPEKIKSLADAITNLTLDREKEDQPTYEALTTEESNQPNNREWRTPDISEGMPRLASAHINRGALKLGDVNLGVNVSGRSKSGAENYRQHAVDVTLPVGRGNVQVSRSRYSDPYSSDTGLRTVYNTYLGDSQYSPTLNMMLEKYKSKKHPSVGVELSFPFGKGGKVSSDDILTKIEKLIRKGQYAVADMIGVKPETKFATEVSERYFPNEEHNERADAMRHMLFQAQLYKRSPLLSNAVGWAHENTALTQPDEEREMDEYNDVLGRGIAITSDDEPQTLVRKALEAIQSGKAKYMTPEENARLRRESAYAAGGSVAQYNPEKIDEIVNQIREAIHG